MKGPTVIVSALAASTIRWTSPTKMLCLCRSRLAASGDSCPCYGSMSVPTETASAAEIRAFFALSLSDDSLSILTQIRDGLLGSNVLARAARPTADSALHLTLKFLGNVPKHALAQFEILLDEALPREPLAATLEGLVCFNSSKHVRVVAANLAEATGELACSANLLSRGVLELGIAEERRAFVPHITLLRLREPKDVSRLLAEQPVASTPLLFDELRLVQSELTPKGSIYHVLGRRRLPSGLVPAATS
jgi:RNA 2',3'-cyclic 3'-phosphodiesterase